MNTVEDNMNNFFTSKEFLKIARTGQDYSLEPFRGYNNYKNLFEMKCITEEELNMVITLKTKTRFNL